MDAPEVRFDPDTGRVAIRMELDPPRTWFVLDTTTGGHYSAGEREGVDDWPAYGFG